MRRPGKSSQALAGFLRARKAVHRPAWAAPLALALLATASPIAAAELPEPGLVHQAFTVADGLPVDAVRQVLQSSDGYLWLATFDGLVRFDGAAFTRFDTVAAPELGSNRILQLAETPGGDLWIRTQRGDLVRRRGGRFEAVELPAPAPGLPPAAVTLLYRDPRGDLWIGTAGGLARYHGGRLRAVALPVPDLSVTALLRDGRGHLWIGSEAGEIVRLGGSEPPRNWRPAALAGAPVTSLAADAAGALWIGARGVHRLFGDSFEAILPSGDGCHVAAEPGGAIWSACATELRRHAEGRAEIVARLGHRQENRGVIVAAGPGGELWTVHGGAIYRAGREIFRLPEDQGALSSLAFDHEGNAWLSAEAGGLHVLKPARVAVLGEDDGLAYRNVYPLHRARDGSLWIGTMRGLSHWTAEGFEGGDLDRGLTNLLVQSIYEDESGTLWVGLLDVPLHRREGERFVALGTESAERPHEDVPTDVLAIHQRQGGVLVAGGRRGLWTSADGGRRWRQVAGAPGVPVQAILETADGALWLATGGAGVVRWAGGRFTAVRAADGLASDLVRALHQDARGRLWVGSEDRGLSRLDPGSVGRPDGPAIATVRESDGLGANGIHRILPDDQGNLWMSSNRGIFRVSLDALDAVLDGGAQRLEATTFDERDGMADREANGGFQGAGLRLGDGRLLFPTQAGVAIIDPAAVRRGLAPPPVHVEEVVAGASSYGAPGAEGVLGLAPGERHFEIAYTGIALGYPERTRFRYRLAGYDDAWVAAGNRRRAFYTGVPPGRYRFEVEAATDGGPWSGSAAALALTIEPFVHETWWFRAAAAAALALAGALGVAWAFRRRTLRHRARERHLEAAVAERTATIQRQAERLREVDALKSRLFADVSHEFRTPLTLTLGPLQDLQEGAFGELGDDARGQVDLARRNAERLLELVDQLLDVARLDSGRLELDRRRFDLAGLLTAQHERFAPLAERQEITFPLELPAGPLAVDGDPEQLAKVVGNLLSNAFKLTPRGGRVRLAPSRAGDGAGRVEIRVRDSGPGIPPEERDRIFERFYRVAGKLAPRHPGTGLGLALARDLAELHGGTIAVESEVGFGSTFIVRLPAAAAQGEPAGEPLAAMAEPRQPRGAPEPAANGSPGPSPAVAARSANGGPGVATQGDEGDEDGEDGEDGEDDDQATVLVVDDNAELRAYVRRGLEGRYRVLEAAAGDAALALAREALPDLVVSDVVMPGVDGHALCRALKEDPELAYVPVILLTARASPEGRLAGLRGGADDYLVKPFDPAELGARIDNLIAGRRRLLERFERVERTDGPAGALPPGLRPSAVEVTPADHAFLARVRERIEARLGDAELSVEALAEELGCDRSYLFRRLRDLAGTTPSALIRHLRLERARALLAGRAGSVSEIAYGVGFKSVSHFSQRFRDAYGEPPSALLGDR